MSAEEIITIDEYIAAAPEEHRETLQRVRETIRAAAPEAEERISYGMPAFWQGENLIYFAANKKHLGLYPTNSGVSAFAERLSAYKTSKGAVQFPWTQSVPYELIAEITRFRLSEALSKRK